MCGEQRLTVFIRSLLRDKRAWALFLLLILALINVWFIIPRSDTTAAVDTDIQNKIIVRLLYMFFVLPTDSSFYECFNTASRLNTASFDLVGFVIGIIFGMLFWCVLIAFSKKHRTILLLVIPYSLYAIFGASVYFYQHHIGITTLFLLFWVWVSEEQKTDGYISLPNRLKKLIEIDSPGHIKLSNLFFAIYVFVVVISASWSVVASFNEIRTACGYGRGAAALIKEYGLEDLNIIIGWQEKQDSKTGKTVYDTNNKP